MQESSTFLKAILHEADESMGIEPRTFTSISDACKYVDELQESTCQQPTTTSNKYVSHEVYQYILDNEANIKHIAEYLQSKYSHQGYLNYLDVPSLNCIYMQCIQVEELWTEEDGSGMEEEEEISGKE